MGYALTQISISDNSSDETFEQLYQLYKSTMSELEIYAQHIPGKDDLKDVKYARQEALLLQVQEEVMSYAAIRPVQTTQDVEALTALWHLSIGPDANESCQMTNKLASKLISFRQGSI